MSLRLDGKNPLSYMGVTPVQPPQQLIKKVRPTANDFQNIEIGTLWLIPSQTSGPSEELWQLMSKSNNVAVWNQINASSGSTYPVNEILVGTGTTNINTIPVGSAGSVLTSNGVGFDASFQSPISGALTFTPVNFAMTPYDVLSTDEFLTVDLTAGAITIKLPNSTTTGRVVYVKDTKGLASTNNITITTVGGGPIIDEAASSIVSSNYQSVSIAFDGTKYWIY